MTPYSVSITSRAGRQIDGLAPGVHERLVAAIRALASNPRPPGCKRMQDSRSQWRIRVGEYRVVYTIDDSTSVVTVVAAGHRGDVYRRR